MSEIKLTLNPFGEGNNAQTAAAVEEVPEEVAVEQAVQADAQNMQTFSEEEQKMIDAFSSQIDIRDTNLVFSYGAAAQQNISQFSDAALKNVQTKDLDEVGDMISNLVVELRGFDADEEERGGLFSFFRKTRLRSTSTRSVKVLSSIRSSFCATSPCWTSCTIRT